MSARARAAALFATTAAALPLLAKQPDLELGEYLAAAVVAGGTHPSDGITVNGYVAHEGRRAGSVADRIQADVPARAAGKSHAGEGAVAAATGVARARACIAVFPGIDHAVATGRRCERAKAGSDRLG